MFVAAFSVSKNKLINERLVLNSGRLNDGLGEGGAGHQGGLCRAPPQRGGQVSPRQGEQQGRLRPSAAQLVDPPGINLFSRGRAKEKCQCPPAYRQ